MRVFLTGASGVIGTRLVPLLVRDGHTVIGTTRSPGKAEALREMGAEPLVLDVLDRDAVAQAVERAAPEAVIHQATDLAALRGFRNFDREFETTNRLRTAGTDHVLAAARRCGVRRVIAQSFGGWVYARTGSALKREDDPIDPSPPRKQRRSLAALSHLEAVVLGGPPAFEGIVLRYGGFYGPGTSLGPGGFAPELLRKRQFPIVGDGAGVWSFIHLEDAASATAAALNHGRPGVYNVTDDDPAPVAEWLPELARIIGAPPPMRVPVWLGRLFAGEVGVSMMTRIRGMSNEKARSELGWRPRYASWRDGFRATFRGQAG